MEIKNHIFDYTKALFWGQGKIFICLLLKGKILNIPKPGDEQRPEKMFWEF